MPKLFTELTGIAVSAEYSTVLTVAVMLVVISVIDTATKRYFPGKNVDELEREYQEKLIALSGLCDKDPAEIDILVRESIGKNLRHRLINAALDFFSPARREGATPIYGPDGINISGEAVQQVPSDLDYMLEETQDVYPVNDVVVDIHRSDVDSRKAGWRAVIEAVSGEKVRTELAPDIDPASLFGKRTIRADVMVVQEKQQTGNFATKVYHIMRVISDANPEKS